jgi:OOP family OmpA-OmpF porin
MKKIVSVVPVIKKMAPVVLVSLFMLPLTAHSEIKAGSVEFSPFVGINIFENRQNLDNMPVFGGRIGYNITNRFGIEAAGEYVRSSVDDKSKKFSSEGQFTSPIDGVNITFYHLDLLYHFFPDGDFNPFIAAGYGAVNYSPKINNKNMSVINFGVGAKYWLSDMIALRVDIRDNMVFDEQINNIQATFGAVLALGGKSKAAPAPVDKPLDSDGDGVVDQFDKCPHTPPGVAVDKDGCPLDSDGDGIPDYLDKCPDTPAGVTVGKYGCPYLIEKVVIIVSDPKVEEVVQEKSKTAIDEPKVIILAFDDVHFGFDQSTLTPDAKTILKKNVQLLKENPKAKIRVAGYTSASGTKEYNQKLSERRAKAVQEYLISEGVIKPNRLATIGYGETHPAAYEAAPSELYSPAAKSNMRVLFEIILE